MNEKERLLSLKAALKTNQKELKEMSCYNAELDFTLNLFFLAIDRAANIRKESDDYDPIQALKDYSRNNYKGGIFIDL